MLEKFKVRFLDTNNLQTHNRHVDQIHFHEPGVSVPVSVINSSSNECILDQMVYTQCKAGHTKQSLSELQSII